MSNSKCGCKGRRGHHCGHHNHHHGHCDPCRHHGPYFGHHHVGGFGCGCGCGCGPSHHRGCGCYGKPIHCSPFDVCIDRLRMRLAHLGGNLGFELHRHIGCKVAVGAFCGDALHTIEGKICGVAGRLVHLKVKSGSSHQVVSIPIEHICKVVWPDKKCNPCHHGCGCGCGCGCCDDDPSDDAED